MDKAKRLIQFLLRASYVNRIAFAFGVTGVAATLTGMGLTGIALPAFATAIATAPAAGKVASRGFASLGRRPIIGRPLKAFTGNFALTLTLLCASATVALGALTPLGLFLATSSLQTLTGIKYLAEQYSPEPSVTADKTATSKSWLRRFLHGEYATSVLVGYGVAGVAAIAIGGGVLGAAIPGFFAGVAVARPLGRWANRGITFARQHSSLAGKVASLPSAALLLAISLSLFSGIFILGAAGPAFLPLVVRVLMGATGVRFIADQPNVQRSPSKPRLSDRVRRMSLGSRGIDIESKSTGMASVAVREVAAPQAQAAPATHRSQPPAMTMDL